MLDDELRRDKLRAEWEREQELKRSSKHYKSVICRSCDGQGCGRCDQRGWYYEEA